MSIWILIMTITGTNTTAIHSAEFSDKVACKEAGKLWKDSITVLNHDIEFVCVPRSSK